MSRRPIAATALALALLLTFSACQKKPPVGADKPAETMESQTAEPAPSVRALGCPAADVKFKAGTDKNRHPTPAPSPGKALVYVLRPTMLGNKIQSKLAVDGEWVGVNRGDNYFFFELEPGEHDFCSRAENASVLSLRLEADQTYYLQQKVQMGFFKARNRLVVLDEAEGRADLEKCHPSTWTVKGQ